MEPSKRFRLAEELTLTSPTGQAKTFKGYSALVEGVDLDLFPVSALSHVLGMPYERIYKLEKRGFPPSLWKLPNDKRCSRYYSRKQLVALEALMSRCRSKRGRLNVTLLIGATQRFFYVIDAPPPKPKRPE
jgi:hypothetical protein